MGFVRGLTGLVERPYDNDNAALLETRLKTAKFCPHIIASNK
jgi:hypothetical protein